ncbi:MAG: MiaB/RimO family radical SAM methylthiotransferase, partial [Spirochaetes bacterium]|nr:MiaB/RimO family radical SAM methylthiotransferase [Spirochaetota bacterium]
MKNFKIITLGCKVNIYESESISYLLQTNQFTAVNTYSEADFTIINTCTVTSKADAKCRNIVRRAKKENPQTFLIVCGCLVNTDISLLKEQLPEVDLFLDNQNKSKVLETINQIKDQKEIILSEDDGTFHYHPQFMSDHSRAFVKIQDGCDNYCSYCKIPYARGHNRSRPIADIIKEIQIFERNGYSEAMLTGINIGSYQYQNNHFASLLKMILNNTQSIRLRLSSIEPQYITQDFCDIFHHQRICPHLHIPLQSGSDKILKMMNRQYTLSQYLSIIKQVTAIRQGMFLSTDLIIGFPGETEQD